MKAQGIVFFAVIILATGICFAAEPDPAVYGTPLIPADFDYDQYKPDHDRPEDIHRVYDAEWRAYANIPTVKQGYRAGIWSPDGTMIALAASDGIVLYSPEDGTMKQVYDNYIMYEGYILDRHMLRLFCFSPDGSEIYFESFLIDDETEVTIKLDSAGNYTGCSISNAKPYLMAVDIETGESRIIEEKSNCAQFSPDGKYFAYYNNERGEIVVTDMETGESHSISVYIHQLRFSPDSSEIIYQYLYSLWRVPVEGGEAVEIPITIAGSGKFMNFELHPDGEWIMYSGGGGPRSGSWTSVEGPLFKGDFSTSDINKLFACNMVTGESLALFPVENDVELDWGIFSPDGSKLYYHFTDRNGPGYSDGIYVMDFDNSVAMKYSDAVSVEDIVPDTFALGTPYPNPFNPATTIEFTLPSAGFTELAVFNTAGQKIRELISGDMAPGAHSVVWDGRNDQGEQVSSGVYISRLKAGVNDATQRLTFVK